MSRRRCFHTELQLPKHPWQYFSKIICNGRTTLYCQPPKVLLGFALGIFAWFLSFGFEESPSSGFVVFFFLVLLTPRLEHSNTVRRGHRRSSGVFFHGNRLLELKRTSSSSAEAELAELPQRMESFDTLEDMEGTGTASRPSAELSDCQEALVCEEVCSSLERPKKPAKNFETELSSDQHRTWIILTKKKKTLLLILNFTPRILANPFSDLCGVSPPNPVSLVLFVRWGWRHSPSWCNTLAWPRFGRSQPGATNFSFDSPAERSVWLVWCVSSC